MEILQTIWTALTTENELLTKIILIPETFIETIVNMLLFTTLLKITTNKQSQIKYFLIVSILGNLFNFLLPNPYKSFINLIMLLICIKQIFKTNIFKTILAVILPIVITVLCESIITKIISLFIDYNSLSLVHVPIYRLIVSLVIQFFVFIIYLIIKYSKIQISILENMSKKNKNIIITNFIFAIFTIAVQFLITGFYLNRLPIYIVIFSNFSLIAYFLLSLYSLTKTMQLEVTELNLEQEKEHNRLLKLAQDDIRGFRHDFANIICTIGGYVDSRDIDGLTNYYNQIKKDVVKINNLTALNPDIINNPAIYALITSKYDKASKLDISVSVEVFLDLNTLNMKIYELTRVLGILLDNAIEAAQECNEKNIYVHIRKDTRFNRQLLIVENTYNNKDVNTDKIFEKNYSSKPNNSGLGLWEVRQILKRNTNLNLYTTKTERLFKQQLEIYSK